MFAGKPGSIAAPHGGGQVTAEVVGVAIPCSSFVVCIYNGTCAMSGDIIPIAQVSQSGNFVKLNLGDGEFAVVPSSRFSQRPYFLAAQDRNGEPPLFDTFESLLGLDGGLLTLSQGDCYRIEVVAAIPAPPQRHDETAVWEHTARHNGIELQDVDVSEKMEFDELCGILSVKGWQQKLDCDTFFGIDSNNGNNDRFLPTDYRSWDRFRRRQSSRQTRLYQRRSSMRRPL